MASLGDIHEMNQNKADCGIVWFNKRSMSKIKTLHCESELAHLGSRVVARQTLINPLIPQSY